MATMLGQVFGVVAVIILARTFPQAEIGVYYVMNSYLGIVSNFALLSYQYALPSADDVETRVLVCGMCCIACIVTISTAIVFYLLNYTYFLPLSIMVFVSGICQLSAMINLRDKTFKAYYAGTAVPAILNLAIVLILWILKRFTAEDLIWGSTILSLLWGFCYFFISCRKYSLPIQPLRGICITLKKHYRSPLLIMPSDILNRMAYNVPTILINQYFGSSWAAQYGIVLKFCDTPVNLIGNTIGQAYLSDLGASVREKDKNAFSKLVKLAKFHGVISILTGLAFFLIAPHLVTIILGPQWQEAGIFIQILAPMYTIMLYNTPLSMLLYVLNKQSYLLLIQLCYLIIALVSFGFGIFTGSIWSAIIMFSALSVIRYLFFLRKIRQVAFELKEMG